MFVVDRQGGARGVWRGGGVGGRCRGLRGVLKQWCAGGCRDLETEATIDKRREIAYVVVWSVDFECCGSAASAGKGMGKWD
jgi:hypothetical protein